MAEYEVRLTDAAKGILLAATSEKLSALLTENETLRKRLSELTDEIHTLREAREQIQRAPAARLELEPDETARGSQYLERQP